MEPFRFIYTFLKFTLVSAILFPVLEYFRRFVALRKFPGPLPAKFTNLWRSREVSKGTANVTSIQLHEKYGTFVRMGPNTISLSDPRLIKTVFSTRNPWIKSDLYSVADVKMNGQRMPHLFSARDREWHERVRRPVAPIYSMTKILELESRIDQTIKVLAKCLNSASVQTGRGASCPFDLWISAFSLEVNSNVTFGKPADFLRNELILPLDHGSNVFEEIRGNEQLRVYLDTAKEEFKYFSAIGQMPILDSLVELRKFWPWSNKTPNAGPNPLIRLVAPAIHGRQVEKPRVPEDDQPADLLSRFIALKQAHPQTVHDGIVFSYSIEQLAAGSDTTASAMLSTIYYTLKHPHVKEKLEAELHAANLSVPPQWHELRNLPYLNAVISEAMRMVPGVGLMLERVVPKGGFALPDSRFIPGGTIVGMNPWVLSRNKGVYGTDAVSFKPERWLQRNDESDEAFKEREHRMREADLAFGHGSRSCFGRNFALLVVYKVVATMFLLYDVSLSMCLMRVLLRSE